MTPSLVKVLNLCNKLHSRESDLANQQNKIYFSILYKLKYRYQAGTQNCKKNVTLATYSFTPCYFQLKRISR